MNQVIQRIGRVVRKNEGKNLALIYVVCVMDTDDDNILDLIKNAIDSNVNRKKPQRMYPTGRVRSR
jgi:superfamily II DNA or RNA helicase